MKKNMWPRVLNVFLILTIFIGSWFLAGVVKLTKKEMSVTDKLALNGIEVAYADVGGVGTAATAGSGCGTGGCSTTTATCTGCSV